MLLACIRCYLKSVRRYKFLILDTFHAKINTSKDVRIRGYFSKPVGVHEQKHFGDTVLGLSYSRVV